MKRSSGIPLRNRPSRSRGIPPAPIGILTRGIVGGTRRRGVTLALLTCHQLQARLAVIATSLAQGIGGSGLGRKVVASTARGLLREPLTDADRGGARSVECRKLTFSTQESPKRRLLSLLMGGAFSSILWTDSARILRKNRGRV